MFEEDDEEEENENDEDFPPFISPTPPSSPVLTSGFIVLRTRHIYKAMGK
jgi:hypothetical protein